jgi:hypothetical protein
MLHPRQIAKFAGLAPQERHLILRAFLVVAMVRVGLSTMRFKSLRRRLAHAGLGRESCQETSFSPAQIANAVTIASSCVPAATCLTQALACQTLLQQYGYTAAIRIGVARNLDGRIEAHAWLERLGRVIIGGPSERLERYTVLPLGERL